MADNTDDADGPRPPIASSMSTASSALTELPESQPQLEHPSRPQAGDGVQMHDFASSGMDVDGNNSVATGRHLDVLDNKSEAGTTVSTDAQTAASTLDDLSTVDSVDGTTLLEDNDKTASTASTGAYKSRVQARHEALRASMPAYAAAQKYAFNSVYNIPQMASQTNAITIPPCSSHLFTGGSDGYIRRYAWYASLRNSPSERHPMLRGYWENLSITAIQARGLLWNSTMQEDPSRIRFGPAGIAGGTTIPVHSLAVQRDEMYCLAGSAEGVINLYSVRLDEGQCRACLGITGKAHKRNSPVSALALSEKDATLLSGAWDKQILQWDLNAGGQCVRGFIGHKNPISTILFRPSGDQSSLPDMDWAVTQAAGSTSQAGASQGDQNGYRDPVANPDLPQVPPVTEADIDGDAEAASPASYDPLFDDDNSASRAASMSRINSPNSTAMEVTNTTDSTAPSGGLTFPGLNIPSSTGLSLSSILALGDAKAAENARVPTPAKLPTVGVPNIPSFADRSQEQLPPFPPPSTEPENTDIFLSCSEDGECLIWDRRIDTGNVRKLDLPKGCPPWSVSAKWSPTGNVVYVGRRNAQVSVYDLRTTAVQSIHLPKSSGRVTALHAMQDNRHILISSNDTVRLWNLEDRNFTIVSSMGSSAQTSALTGNNGLAAQAGNGPAGTVPYSVSNGGHTAFVADQREKYLFAACGNRGWLENGREEIGTFEIDPSH